MERTQLVYFSLVGGGDGKNALRSRCVEVCVDGGSMAHAGSTGHVIAVG
ncbi:unnamed protein product [Mycetohabitans rhizoxinica HKI 454]|uniref:Uncharacterized protein n=1 Tax=Mycetohabitans rhizoxinica (strain DSM 19002 / CIP 109453 / HKI 454) TaxID=882378 RepID=E5AQ78_MYCRK|nr:hypothetical protein [Mycetohabitans sp. B6]CBW74760.1 unnamed protein product [Mycetohabitans rhizoxinica HKI 454]